MDKLIFLSDLHGNWQAAQAMENEIRKIGPTKIWFLGDAVGKGPDSDLTCDWVRNNCDYFIAGNWDTGLSRSFYQHTNAADHFYWNQIGKERFDWLSSLPLEGSVWISGFHFRLVHGRTLDPLYLANDPIDKLLKGFVSSDGKTSYSGLICGDCHTAFVRPTPEGFAINCGSVGNSLDVTNAHALLIEGDLDSREKTPIRMSILSVPYDNQAAIERAWECPEIPLYRSYINEIKTGIYSRLMPEFQDE